jgi:predicted ATPase
MYIHRIILRDVKVFESQDLTFWNDWTEKPLARVLFTGANGSGKTTLLNLIAALWGSFEDWLQEGRASNRWPLLKEAGLAAIELRDFPSIEGSLWLFVASNAQSLEEFRQTAQSHLVGETRLNRGRPNLELDPLLRERLNTARQALRLGKREGLSLPNMIFLESETRLLTPPSKGRPDTYPEMAYRWLATYEAQDHWDGHLEGMLRNLKVIDENRYQQTLKEINQFLYQKELYGFDHSNGRALIRLENKYKHYLDDLSAGERQCLIMMFTISRWLEPGGVVLIDEPDLHLHLSLQRHFLHEAGRVVAAQGGQLIVTAHSPEMWDDFNQWEAFDLEQ